MQLYWTVRELMVLTRRELCELYDQIVNALPDLEAGSVERREALLTLENIRQIVAKPGLHHPEM